MGYPNLKNDTELLKRKTKDDEIKDLIYKTEKHDHENTLKLPKTDNEYYKRRYKSLKKTLLIITEISIEGGSTISSSTVA